MSNNIYFRSILFTFTRFPLAVYIVTDDPLHLVALILKGSCAHETWCLSPWLVDKALSLSLIRVFWKNKYSSVWRLLRLSRRSTGTML